jgi:hypothetical protein
MLAGLRDPHITSPLQRWLLLIETAEELFNITQTVGAQMIRYHWFPNVNEVDNEAVAKLDTIFHAEYDVQQWEPRLPSRSISETKAMHETHTQVIQYFWVSKVMEYRNDWAVYTWQPFQQPPEKNSVKLLIRTEKGKNGLQKAIMSVNSPRVLKAVRRLYQAHNHVQQPISSQAYQYFLGALINRLICIDTVHFITKISAQLDSLVCFPLRLV